MSFTLLPFCGKVKANDKDGPLFRSLDGLVMAGYQGWFNAEGDGSGLGWKHYAKNGEFRPGACSVDMWPDVSEYQKTYPTEFRYADGRTAMVFSSRDSSTTFLHFKWMQEYGIDGVFMQRFLTTLRSEKGRENYNLILSDAVNAAEKYGRAICLMYDLSGIDSEHIGILAEDWEQIGRKLTDSPNYLRHNGKPLVAVWGVGFNDNRQYGYDDIQKIISFLKSHGCSVMLGVPAFWRSLTMDTLPDEKLHSLIEQADVIHPWFVGRYNYDSYDRIQEVIRQDVEWCGKHGKDYIPVVFPGFSWFNLKNGVAAPLDQIPRMGGKFLWKQVHGAIEAGAESLYIAMFDEMDEGTAIFKCAGEVPVGKSPFVSCEDTESDRYLWLAGMAAKMLRGEIPLDRTMPQRAEYSGGTEGYDLTAYVNPYIGNISHVLVPTYPTVHRPNSLLRVYPERDDYTSVQVKGLPVIVTSHRGRSAFNLSFWQGEESGLRPYYMYCYNNEKITPYSYEADFYNEDVHVSFSPDEKAAIYELEFGRKDEPAYLIFNADNGELEWNGHRLEGWQYIDGKTRIWLSAEFSPAPMKCIGGSQEKNRYSALGFAEGTGKIEVRYGISLISCEQAGKNLDGIKDKDLCSLIDEGREIWNGKLGKIEVSGDEPDMKTVFYTALYRTYERMVNITEDGRYYSAFDGKVHEDTVDFYTDDWIWDTYRATHPLRTIIEPEMEGRMIYSFLRMASQSEHKWMPTFPEVTGDSRRMNSNHGVATVADAACKGISGFDLGEAYRYCKAGITEKTLAPWSGCEAGKLTKFYWKHGYIPALADGEEETYPEVHPFERRQPVAVTLGTSYDTWCLSRIADMLGKEKEASYFGERAKDYRNLFNPETRFFHPKNEKGEFITPFDYTRSGGMGARGAYGENNGWIYRWDVPHDISGLISLMGGKKAFSEELDRMFRTPLGDSKYSFWAQLPDHTGNVGQFSMANEPSLHIPYLYAYVGEPWKTQKCINDLIREWFRNDLMGMPGDEDGGGMSAFVVFSMMGFYPVTPGLPVYVIGSPMFRNVTINLENGKTFTIKCLNYSPDNKFIQSARLNGKPLERCWFTHEELVSGGELEFVMGSRPQKEWGARNLPPESMSEIEGRCTFVQISDPQFGFREKEGFAKAQELMERAVSMTNVIRPDFVVVTGDMTDSPDDSLQFRAYMETADMISDDIPVYHIPGNHDIGRCTEENLRRYIGKYGYDRFSFTWDGCAFIGINSSVIKECSQPYERIQYRWLRKELRNMKDTDIRIIFSHIPPVLGFCGEPENYSNFPVRMQEKYISLFARHHVTAVISGHLHNTSECTAGEVRIITSGPCGIPLGDGISGIACCTADHRNGLDWRYIESLEKNLSDNQ